MCAYTRGRPQTRLWWWDGASSCGDRPRPPPLLRARVHSGCDINKVGDWVCNPECNSKLCKWDGGDCVGGANNPFTVYEADVAYLEVCRADDGSTQSPSCAASFPEGTQQAGTKIILSLNDTCCCAAGHDGKCDGSDDYEDFYDRGGARCEQDGVKFNGPRCNSFYLCAKPWCDPDAFELGPQPKNVKLDGDGEDFAHFELGAERFDMGGDSACRCAAGPSDCLQLRAQGAELSPPLLRLRVGPSQRQPLPFFVCTLSPGRSHHVSNLHQRKRGRERHVSAAVERPVRLTIRHAGLS